MTVSIWSLIAAPFVLAGLVWLLEIIDRKQLERWRRSNSERTDR